MTTNKPEVKRYTPAYGVDSVMRGNLFMGECERGAWVSLEDHEALQAECEKLRKDAERYHWLIDRGDDFQWENIIRVDIEDFTSRDAAITTAKGTTHARPNQPHQKRPAQAPLSRPSSRRQASRPAQSLRSRPSQRA